MAATAAPTISELKAAFLRQQILTLATPLQDPGDPLPPPRGAPDAPPLARRAVATALARANQRLRSHNRLVYGQRALRHVAEQIERSYVVAAPVPAGFPCSVHAGDYTADAVIAQLPVVWNAAVDDADLNVEEELSETDALRRQSHATQYAALRARLVELSTRRRLVKEAVERARALKDLMKNFDKDVVQTNLVTRDGDLEQELERMRRLMIRVERGAASLGENGRANEEDQGLEENEPEEKVLALLV